MDMKQSLYLSYSNLAASTSSGKKSVKVSVGCPAFDHSFLSFKLEPSPGKIHLSYSSDSEIPKLLFQEFSNSRIVARPLSGACHRQPQKLLFLPGISEDSQQNLTGIEGWECPHQVGGFRINWAVSIQIN